MPKRMVRWDENDVEALAEEVAKLRVSRPEESLVVLINAAQKTVFPPERHRKILQVKNCGEGFLKYLKRSLTELKPVHATAPAANKPIIEYRDPDESEVLATCSTTNLVNAMMARIIHNLEVFTSALAKSGLATGPIEMTVQQRKTVTPVVRIGIAGMDASHFYALQNRIGALADLKYVNHERPQAPPTMDAVVVCGVARKYWKEFEHPKVHRCEEDNLAAVASLVKTLIPTPATP